MNSTETPPPSPRGTVTELLTDAIRYWEPRRLLYNGILTVIVVGYFAASLPHSWRMVSLDGFLGLVVLAVLANLCYCAAYIVDIFAQLSGFRSLWLRRRWVLLAIGVLFASILTRFVAIAAFSGPPA